MNKYDSCLYLDSDKSIDWGDTFGKMKPGAHAVAICPVLEHHRITQSIEDVGFEIRDCILFLDTPRFMITLARVPLEGTVAQNVLMHGTGALNVDGCRIESNGEHMRGEIKSRNTGGWAESKGMHTPGRGFVATDHPGGRWPANCILSGEVNLVKMFPSSKGSPLEWQSTGARDGIAMNCSEDGSMRKAATYQGYGDDGSAARFFHNVSEDGSLQELISYLCKLCTPPQGNALVVNTEKDAIMSLESLGFNIIEYRNNFEYSGNYEHRSNE